MKNLEIEEIPVPTGASHPDAPFEQLPKHEFTMCFVAPKGSGKTTLMINLLKFYKKYFHTIVIFSPTILNDEKWDWVKKQPFLRENKKFKEYLRIRKKKENDNGIVKNNQDQSELFDKIVEDANKLGKEKDEKEKFTGLIPEQFFITEYTESTLLQIISEQQKVIDFLKRDGKTRHLANRILWIFDDLVGSNLFSNKTDNPFKVLNTTHRHLSSSILMVTQAYREIPKTVRTNYTCLILFSIANDLEIKAIMEEYPLGLKKEQWLQVYQYCTNEKYSFMYCDLLKPGGALIMKRFKEKICFKKIESNDQELLTI